LTASAILLNGVSAALSPIVIKVPAPVRRSKRYLLTSSARAQNSFTAITAPNSSSRV